MDGTIELLFGSLLIVIYATQRFNNPPAIRSSTTAGRYYASVTTYLLIYLATFYVCTKYPKLLEFFAIDTTDLNAHGVSSNQSNIILGALLLSLLVPRIPIISEVDKRLRRFLHRLAAIPYEAIRLSSEIQSSRYEVPPQLQDALYSELENQGFEQDKIDVDDSVMARWISIVSLMVQLEDWKRSRQFSSFIEERSGQFDRLTEHYARLAKSALNAVSLSRQASDQPNMSALQDAAQKFRNDLQIQQQVLLSEISDFISHSVLKTCFRYGHRQQVLRDMGFVDVKPETHLGLSINQTVMLFGLLLLLVLTNFILFRPEGEDIERILIKVTMIVSIYAGAVICAVLPKQRWRLFQYRTGEYPAVGYLLSGIMAMVISMIIGLLFKVLIFAGSTQVSGFNQPLAMAWGQFTTSSYPWLTMSFAVAVFISFLIDWRMPAWIHRRFSRFVSGFVQAMVMAAAATMVHIWLTSLSASNLFEGEVPEISMVLRVSILIGFVIGYMVPYWYHARDRHEEPNNDEATPADEALMPATPSKPDYAVVTRMHDGHG